MFGAWGKVGINCFVLITGYFMCTGRVTVQKFLKLYFQILFYNIIIGLIFFVCGRESFKISTVFYWFWPFKDLTFGFTGAFLALFFFVPYLNKLIDGLGRQEHLRMLLALLFFFSVLPVVPFFKVVNNYVCWFAVVYLVGAYIRRYPLKMFERRGRMFYLAAVSFILGNLSVVVTTNLLPRLMRVRLPWYHWLADSEKITALAAAVAFFLFFRSLRLPYLKIINVVASATFGVLLIHANCDTMRRWLWQDVCQNVEYYPVGIGRAVLIVLCVYVICVVLELCRQRLFAIVNRLVRVGRLEVG